MGCSPVCCCYKEAVALPLLTCAHAKEPQNSTLQLSQVVNKHQYPWLLIDLYSFLLPLRQCRLHSRAIFRRDLGPKGPCKGHVACVRLCCGPEVGQGFASIPG